jgi:hydrogenase/urease accessory protein HupE
LKTTALPHFDSALRRGLAAALLTLLALLAMPAAAHKASDAYLQLDARPDGVDVRWDIALRDLDVVLALDADGDRALTWGEVRGALPRIEAHVLPRLAIEGCALRPAAQALETRSDGTYLALTLRAACTPPPGLPLRYTLFAESDATHRGIAQVRGTDGRTEVRLLDPGAAGASSGADGSDGSNTARAAPPSSSFVAEGVHHILTGYDHLLFLLCLLLPVALGRQGRTMWAVAGIATLFTVAHSLTLALSALGGVSLPPSIVEPAIALTIVVAAIDNLRPLFGRWRLAVTFAFGLVHGFGFAGVLQELELPAAEFGWALLRFNAGLELGQLGVLALAAPVLMAIGRAPAWRRPVMQGGSLAAAALALVWFAERAAPALA